VNVNESELRDLSERYETFRGIADKLKCSPGAVAKRFRELKLPHPRDVEGDRDV